MSRRVLLAYVVMVTVESTAPAVAGPNDEVSLKYSAFDLGVKQIPIFRLGAGEQYSSNRISAGALTLTCLAWPKPIGASNQVVVTPDVNKVCPLFAAREPDTFSVLLTTQVAGVPAPKQTTITAAFDKGSDFTGPVWFDGSYLHIGPQIRASTRHDVCLAYYSSQGSTWVNKADVVDDDTNPAEHTVLLPIKELSGSIYVRHGKCPAVDAEAPAAAITRLSYPIMVMRDLTTLDCNSITNYMQAYVPSDMHAGILKNTPQTEGANYRICIDQANSLGQARIVENTTHYISTFMWGKVVIRHWRNVVPVMTIAGVGVSVNQARFAGSAAAPSPTTPSAAAASPNGGFALPGSFDGQGIAGDTKGDYLVSTAFIPPHAPGALHIDIKFLDPVDAKPKAATAIDLAVDQGYSGALRLGVGDVLAAHEYSYKKLKRSEGAPEEIVEQSAAPAEVVVGYSVFCSGAAGRTYATRPGKFWGRVCQHLGVFVGFGTLSYTPGNIDFLKSIHLGIDLEVNRNVSLAITAVGRRTSQLDGGLRAGGPAPTGDIPTSSRYGFGIGVILSFSTEFLSFVSSPPAGGSK